MRNGRDADRITCKIRKRTSKRWGWGGKIFTIKSEESLMITHSVVEDVRKQVLSAMTRGCNLT